MPIHIMHSLGGPWEAEATLCAAVAVAEEGPVEGVVAEEDPAEAVDVIKTIL
jgi:hypothetical protein